jgi:hypothetical protein
MIIETFPFFKGYYGQGKAIIDIVLLEKWLNENYEIMSDDDESDRKSAYEELERGESLNLKEAMNEW